MKTLLKTITDPAVLARYPHLEPERLVLEDTVVTERGKHREARGLKSESTYRLDPGRPRAGHGALAQCQVCGTMLRAGQPHSALTPVAHQTLDMLTVEERLPRLGAADAEPF